MTRFKLCPYCGTKNPPAMLECSQCEADLTAVRAADGAQPPEAAPPEAEISAEIEPQARRVCEECGTANPAGARKCSQCGADISYITPVSAGGLRCTLASDDGTEFELTAPITVVGREAALAEYLADKGYVGRKQAEFALTEDGLYIKNLGRTNGTFVNGERLGDAARKLCGGEVIGLGGNPDSGRQPLAAYFTVKISCS